MAEVAHFQVTFRGRVQGVGFRVSVLQVAREYEVAGYVQNLADGSVLVEAEGVDAELERFVEAVTQTMQGYIRAIERTHGRRAPLFQNFVIR